MGILQQGITGTKLKIQILRGQDTLDCEVIGDPFPFEQVEGVHFDYGSFVSSLGDHLRTIISRPDKSESKLPAILFIQWLSCDAIDADPLYNDGNIQLIHDLSKAGYLVMRTEKPGVGDSKGRSCAKYGFNDELDIHRQALQQLRLNPMVDTNHIYLFGSSIGGTMAPIVAKNQNIAGLIVTGCYYKTWYEHMLEIERRILTLGGTSPSITNDKMKLWSKFYSLYLNDRMTPKQIIDQHPEFEDLWTDEPEHQYGRPVSFYMEANEHNVAAYWDLINVPVLVVYGEYDWIMSKQDHLMIVNALNQKKPGLGTYFEVPKTTHGLLKTTSLKAAFDDYSPDYDPLISKTVITWLQSSFRK